MDGQAGHGNRRQLLWGLAAGGAWALAASAAGAVTARPRSDYGAILDAACGPTADHQRQIAAVEDALGLTLPDARAADILRRTLCPACGCPLVPPAGAPGSF